MRQRKPSPPAKPAKQHRNLGKELPELVGGSADLTPSNLTDWSNSVSVTRDKGGNYIHYGVREFGMGAIMNGLVLHGGVNPSARLS